MGKVRWWWRDGGDAVRVAAALGGAVVRGGAVRGGGEERCWFDGLEGGCLGIYIGEGRVLLGVGDKK